MKILNLNLANQEKSDIGYSISRFPDGEVQLILQEFSRKNLVNVRCRITSPEELFILMQAADILNRHEVQWNLEIYYLMSMRMDRVMDFNRPFSLKIVANIIKNLGADRISVLDAHSRETHRLLGGFGICDEMVVSSKEFYELHPDMDKVYENYQVVFPDAGAKDRYGSQYKCVCAEKVRDVATGQIQSIKILNPELLSENDKPILVVDDLCDGGGTFVGIATELRKYTNKELNIFVVHMVNPRGIENLSKTYDHVYFTDSYKDWSGFKAEFGKAVPLLPENVTQINVV